MSRLQVCVLLVTAFWSVVGYNSSAVSQTSGSSLAIDGTFSGDNSSRNHFVATQSFSTATANDLLLAFVSTDSNPTSGNTVTSVSGAGLTWQLVARGNSVPGDAEIWRAFSPAVLNNVTVTANFSQSAAASITVIAFSGADISGGNGSSAIGATASFSAASGAPTGSVITTRDNSWVFAVGDDWDNAIPRTLGPNQTMVHQYLATVGDTYWVQRENSASSPAGTTVTINDTAPTSDKYNLALVEILPAASTAPNPDFGLTISPSSQSVQAGGSTAYTATISGMNGFSGAVNLSASGLPNGATASFNPSSVNGSGTSQLTVTTTGSLASGNYPFTVTATSGSLTHSVTLTLVVSAPADFSLAVTPSTQSVSPGSSVNYTATVTAQNGFTGPTNLTVTGLPNGATAVFTPQSVTGSGSGQLTVNASSTTPAGTYLLTITGTSGTLVHSAKATLTVSASGTPSVLAIDTVSSADRSSANTQSSTAQFSTTAPNELLLAFISSDSSTTSGNTVMSVSGAGLTWQLVARANGALGDAEIWRAFAPAVLSNVIVTANLSQSAAASITVVAFNGVDTSGSNGSGAVGAKAVFSAASGAPTGSVTTTRDGSWVFAVGADWDNAISRTLGPNQAMVHEYLATMGDTYWVQRQNSASAPAGTVVTMNDTAPTSDQYNFAVVEVLPTTGSGVAPNPDFSLTASPSSQSVQVGSSTNYALTITGTNGFSGSVNLSASGLPNGATASFNPSPVNGSGTSQLTVATTGSVAPGNYPFTVTATSGSLTHNVNLTLVVGAAADFSLSLMPTSQSVQPGSSVNYTTTITAQNGYSAATNLTVTGLPTAATAKFTPQSITGSGTAQLTISTSTTTPTGSYSIAITGSSGTLSHSASATLVVSAAADFAITATPSSQSIQPGASTAYTVNINGQNGYAGVANLTASGLPSGATAAFNPTSVNGTGSSQLTVTTVGSTPAGTYPLTITATSGSEVHTASVTLVVAAGIQHSVALSWTDTDSGIAGYNVYRSNQSGSGYTKLNTSLITTTSYSDSTVQSGTTYYYVATAVNTSGVESGFSSAVQAVIPWIFESIRYGRSPRRGAASIPG